MFAQLLFAKAELSIWAHPCRCFHDAVGQLAAFPQSPIRKLTPVVIALRRGDEIDHDYRGGDRNDGYPMPSASGQQNDAEDESNGGQNQRHEIAAYDQRRACLLVSSLTWFGATLCGWLFDWFLHLQMMPVRYRTSMTDDASSYKFSA